jgi:hypothetical protein
MPCGNQTRSVSSKTLRRQAVAPLTSQPYVLVSGKSAGITTVRELIAAAKINPGGLKFGSTGIGIGTHLGLVKFNLQAGVEAVHVPPRPGDVITDVIANAVAGRTTYMLAPKNPTPRIRMLDGFNEGWIEFESAEAGSRKGKVGLQAVLQTLIESRQ